jgi:hypothetical protein
LKRASRAPNDSIPSKSSSSQLASSPVAAGTESRREDGDQEAEAANGRDGQGHGREAEAEAEEEDLAREVSRAESFSSPAAMQDDLVGRVADVVAAAGDQATSFVILGSIVVPLAILTAVCWFFWKHRHDD